MADLLAALALLTFAGVVRVGGNDNCFVCGISGFGSGTQSKEEG